MTVIMRSTVFKLSSVQLSLIIFRFIEINSHVAASQV